MKKTVVMSAVVATAALTLAACGSAPEESGSASETTAAESSDAAESVDFLACMVSDEGGFDDKSFNETSYAGMTQAESELGVSLAQAESQSAEDYVPNMDQMVQQGCNQIIGVGYNLAAAASAAAEANPDIEFALVDSTFDPAGDNAKPLVFNTAEAAYLAGYVAAGMTETDKVATFGGMQLPTVAIFMDGFADGVAKYNEDNGTSVELLGWDKEKQEGSFSGDFTNQDQGRVLTEGFIAQGADIIMPVAGPVGLGAAQAAKDGNAKIIWVDTDGYESTEYGDIILTSVEKKMGEAVYESIKAGVEGTFSSDSYIGTLENGGVDISPFHDFDSAVPQELKDQVDALREAIIAGDIVVETTNAP